jgi:hypothetical protein
MKKISLLLACAIYFLSINVNGQTDVINIDDSPTYTGCDFILHDDNGGLVPYSADAFNVMTICSTTGNQLNLYFLTFSLSPNDLFSVYDGPSTADPLVGTYSGTDLQFQMISSTNASGCLTVLFFANGDDQTGDFIAQGSCGVPCSFPLATITASEPTPFLGCPSEQITFDGSTSFLPNGSSLFAHNWDFGDGTSDNVSWPTVTHSYTQPGVYHVVLTITVLSADGSQQCSNQNTGEYYVYISTPIQWNTAVSDDAVCVGVPVYLGSTEWVASPDMAIQNSPANASFPTYVVPQGVDFGGAAYIPDNQGCFQADLTFTQFGSATVTSIADIVGITGNIEHSFASDIVINIICPQGNTLQLFNGNSGGGVFLGEPIDVEDQMQPGIGYDYTWSSTVPVAFNTAISGISSGSSLPAGSYNADGAWDALLGCTLNGTWQFQICDQVNFDDGFIFGWSIQFAPQFYPDSISFTPEALPGNQDSFWSPANNLTFQDANMNNVVFMSNTQGVFPLVYQVTSDFGCTYDTTFNITVYGPPTISFSDSIPFCGLPVNLNPTYGNALPNTTYAYQWSPAANVTVPNIAFPQATGVQNATWIAVTSWPTYDNSCTGSDSVRVWIPATPPTAPFTTDSVCLNEQIFLNSPFTNSSYSYQWFLSDTIVPNAIDPIYSPWAGVPNEQFVYSIEITEPVCGFSSTTDFGVTSLPCDVFLPNIVLLNGTEENQTLNFDDALFYYANASLVVFNRWGDLVYESTDYKNDWSPSELSDGVFYYILKVTSPTGKVEDFTGYFHLIRN